MRKGTKEMKGTIERYLDRVMSVADIADKEKETRIREELRDHLEQKVETLESEGYERAEALVRAVEDHGNAVVIGYRLRPWRLVDVRLRGTARGVIAIGPKAKGVVAIGGLAMGVFAFGGVAIGAFSFGGMALALLLAWGGFAGGTVTYGGLSFGVVAFGGMSFGVIASGATAAGIWVPGAAHVLWSYFNWETVPGWWRGIGEYLSFNPHSATEREAFSSFIGFLTFLSVLFVAVMVSINGILMYKERKRVQGIEPSAVE